ncbi:MAG: hypothetical protein JSS23_03895 [Proteobacteria bacterium]|nr:hypothetical protein [Pseudomonadota bacterium]
MRFDKDTRKMLEREGARLEGRNLQQAQTYNERMNQAVAFVNTAQQLAVDGEAVYPGGDTPAQDAQVAALASAHADVIIEALKAIASLGLQPSGVLGIRREELMGRNPMIGMEAYVRAERLAAASRAVR